MQQNDECKEAGHQQRRIITICFSTKCQGNLCCQKCEHQLHNDHRDQLVDRFYLLDFIKIVSEIESFPLFKVDQPFLISSKVVNQLNNLQRQINHQMEQLSFLELQIICRNMMNRYTKEENGTLRFDNSKLNDFGIDMFKYFKAKNQKIVEDYFFLDEKDDFRSYTYVCSEIKIIRSIIKEHCSNNKNSGYYCDQILKGHESRVYSVDICKNKNLLASGSEDKTVKLWSLDNNSLIKTFNHSSKIYNVVLSNHGNLLAYCGEGDPAIQLIDISDLSQNSIVIQLLGHHKSIRKLKFSKDQNYLLSSSEDKTVRIWNVQLNKEKFQLASLYTVYGVDINEDNTLIATNSLDGNLKIWSVQNEKLLCSQHIKGQRFNYAVAFSNRRTLVSSGNYSNIFQLWTLIQSSKLVLIRQFRADIQFVDQINFSSCSQIIIYISQNKIEVIDSQKGSAVNIFTSNSRSRYTKQLQILIQRGLAISPDQEVLVFGENNQIVVFRK